MSQVIESGIGTLNYGKQTVKGTPATAATVTVGYNRPKWFDGVLKPGVILGSEEYIDGLRFGSPAQWVNDVGGMVGTVTIQAQPENAGLYMAQLLGVDTVTGAADPWTHTITSAGSSGSYATWWQKVGVAVGPEREMFIDSKIAKLLVTCGDKQNPLHYAIDIACLNPSQVFEIDAAKTEDATDPYYWNETEGGITFDGTVLTDVDEETLEIDTGIKPFSANSITPAQLIEGKGKIIRTLKSIVTDETLAKFRKTVYGTTTPALGAKPVKTVFFAAAKTVYTKTATRTLTYTTPKIAVKPDEMVVGPLREGGEIQIAFGGECLKEGATAALTVIALSADTTTYA
jgi:hypothetical protein